MTLKRTLVLGLIVGAGSVGTYFYSNPDSISSFSLSSTAAKKKSNKREVELSQAEKTKVVTEQQVIFNDPALSEAWGIQKADAIKAWELSKGNRNILVAVIDTGIDINHEDLKSNLWKNPGETGLDAKGRDKATNGIDDDGNGFVDDVHGWNFVSNTPNLEDNHGHGTHIAGIIGAEANNKKGIAGVSPQVSLMVLKYFDPKVSGTDNLKNTIASIRYAIANGAQIINYSGGGTEFSLEEKNAIEEAKQKGILFVAAAGNERSNSDLYKYYPADYGLENIISVTAIDPKTEVLPSSNYGVETVDIGAPGQNILSTLPGSSYGFMTGTSQATAFVTGAAVLVMAHHSENDYAQVKKYIVQTGNSNSSLLAKTRNYKQLNLFKALTMLDSRTGVSGVTAVNANKIPRFSITAPEADNSPRSIATFGKSLMEKMERNATVLKEN